MKKKDLKNNKLEIQEQEGEKNENLNNTNSKEKTMLCFEHKFNSKTLTLAFFSHRLFTYQIRELKKP
jgi:hypothetical protein